MVRRRGEAQRECTTLLRAAQRGTLSMHHSLKGSLEEGALKLWEMMRHPFGRSLKEALKSMHHPLQRSFKEAVRAAFKEDAPPLQEKL